MDGIIPIDFNLFAEIRNVLLLKPILFTTSVTTKNMLELVDGNKWKTFTTAGKEYVCCLDTVPPKFLKQIIIVKFPDTTKN